MHEYDWDAPACEFIFAVVADGRVWCGKAAAGYVVCHCEECGGGRIPLCDECLRFVEERLRHNSP